MDKFVTDLGDAKEETKSTQHSGVLDGAFPPDPIYDPKP